ncbi:hypothetical protein CSOJ01_08905 [Colletotrichum sojae]|uniref:Uncharacterized protein n=1 Tax=Colletotrichum sojae TaxID=2175907 RepID=A0A8H6MRI7_9PEZI|nr:hypothetical protein CSOJ01_08905 [Colletotrichum sojae]
MSPQSSNKAPSAGTKVCSPRLRPSSQTPGASAPVKKEPAGPVPEGSLAAESARGGGAFASNEGVRSSSGTSGTSGTGSASRSGASSVPGKAGTAPTYVNNQYIRDQSGPHGKNITEGFDTKNTKDGVQEAFKSEVGGENDPGRAAERHFQLSQTKAARDAGPRQTETGSQTVYDKLESDVQA